MLNKSGPKIDPCGTPDTISSHELYEDPIFLLYSLDNLESFLMPGVTVRRHVVLQLASHDKCNEKLLRGR